MCAFLLVYHLCSAIALVHKFIFPPACVCALSKTLHCSVSELPFGGAGAKIGLIDYGQSKQLPLDAKLAFAQLIHALDEQNDSQIGEALGRLGVVLEAGDPALTSRMAYGMFDTRGR